MKKLRMLMIIGILAVGQVLISQNQTISKSFSKKANKPLLNTIKKQSFTGTWNTSFGELRLKQSGNKVYGDYKNVGKINGIYNSKTKKLTGTFTNRKKKGFIEFTLSGNKFTGKWGWNKSKLNSTWNGTKTNSASKTTVTKNLSVSKNKNINWKRIFKQPVVINSYNKGTAPKANRPVVKTVNGETVTVSINEKGKFSNRQREIKTVQKDRDCVQRTYTMDVNTSTIDFIKMNQNADWLQPGALLETQSVLTGSNAVAYQARNPINLAITANGEQIIKSVTVNNPTPTQLTSEANRLISQSNSYASGAEIKYESKEIHSEKDFALKVNGYYNDISGIKASLGFNFSKKTKRNYVLVDFTQSYYTIFTDPLNPTQVFKNPSDNSKVNDYVYISSVTYGRRALLMLETDYTAKQVESALNAEYDAAGTRGGVNIDVNMKDIISNSNKKLIVYGGSARDAVKIINENDMLQGFKNYIQSSFNGVGTGNGKPIGYSFRFASDNKLCALRSQFKQTREECKPFVPEVKVKLTISKVKCLASDDRDNMDDYIINLSAKSKNHNGKIIPMVQPEFLFRNAVHDNLYKSNKNNVRLIKSDEKAQIHIREGKTQSIYNSGIYKISKEDIGSNASIDLTLDIVERTGKDRIRIAKNELRRINLKEALRYLQKVTNFTDYGNPINKSGDIKGRYIKLKQGYTIMKEVGNPDGQRVLEGYFWNGNKKRKTAVFFTLELVEDN
ncbi:thiol-activated cytolysin family protein [Tenacibaculum sp. 190524A05c]|uniref:thiol-activated cytolysin family protein n=1 Tax=Tenacibaculum platacis TaxID=3137852 RepID=UPI0031FAFC99